MLGDPLKRSQLFTAIWVGLLFLYCCQIAHLSSASANDSVSKKRRFIKAFLQAEKGDPEAQYTVGMMYYSGQDVPHDSTLAIVWFTKAAEQDYSQAQYFLSLMYGLGDGVTQSDRKAKLPSRAMRMLNTVSAECIRPARVYLQMMPGRLSGCSKPPSRAISMPSVTLA
jgi:TPR repeat protein